MMYNNPPSVCVFRFSTTVVKLGIVKSNTAGELKFEIQADYYRCRMLSRYLSAEHTKPLVLMINLFNKLRVFERFEFPLYILTKMHAARDTLHDRYGVKESEI